MKKKLKLCIKKTFSTSFALSLLFCNFSNNIFADKGDEYKPYIANKKQKIELGFTPFQNKDQLNDSMLKVYRSFSTSPYRGYGSQDCALQRYRGLFKEILRILQDKRGYKEPVLYTYCAKCGKKCGEKCGKLTGHHFHTCQEGMRLFICEECGDGFVMHKEEFINSHDIFRNKKGKLYNNNDLRRVDLGCL